MSSECEEQNGEVQIAHVQDYTTASDLSVFLRNFASENTTRRVNRRSFIPPAISLKSRMTYGPISADAALGLAEKMIQTFSLNPDQAAALVRIAQMMASSGSTEAVGEHQTPPITIIRGIRAVFPQPDRSSRSQAAYSNHVE